MKTDKFWYQKHPLRYVLWPFAVFYRAAMALRRALYQPGWLQVYTAPVPVVVVGNITVGGTGKTPIIIWLAQFLKDNGLQAGIVSRGYGGKGPFPQLVTANSAPQIVGDEPILIAKKTGCPVVVAPDRAQAIQYLLQRHPCHLVLSDDGLQHYRMQRSLEIVVIDGERRFGNQHCLPAGPLREPLSRLKTVDIVLCNGIPEGNEIGFILELQDAYQITAPQLARPLTEFKTVHAVAAIGNPQRFFNALRAKGLDVIEHAFPDHYPFKQADIDFGADAVVLMTEKDAVKCTTFADSRHWCVPAQVNMAPLAIEVFKRTLL